MGLMKLSSAARDWIMDLVGGDRSLVTSLDTTGLLSLLIEAGYPVVGTAIEGGWAEIDNEADLAVAEALVAEGGLLRPIGV